MKLKVLGCSGGIGGGHLRTTALLVDHDILIDAGTGLADLSVADLTKIDHVFLTHTHLDHIACLPLMLDTVADNRDHPLVVHALPEIIAILKAHLFNGWIWPDFSTIPRPDAPFMRFSPIVPGEPVTLGECRITALAVDHTVPASAFRLDSGKASLVFSGDTGPCDAFWEAVNGIDNLRHLIIECAFPDSEAELARRSKHLCPSTLAAELGKLNRTCEIHITHLKPGQLEQTMAEIKHGLDRFRPRMLYNGALFSF